MTKYKKAVEEMRKVAERKSGKEKYGWLSIAGHIERYLKTKNEKA